jgi:hypothetical protein
MHPPNEVTGLALLIGLMLGALLGLNGFAEPVQAKEWKSSTRVRNFAWLFTGMIGVVLADYKRLGFGEEIRPISMTVWYSSGAALGLVGSIAVMCMTIARSAWVWNRPRPPHSRIDAWAMMREYLTYGKSRFDEKWVADTSGLERRGDAERRAGVARADKDVARCVFSVLQHVKRPEAVRASEAGLLIESVIAAAILVIRSHSRHPREIRLAGSYMVGSDQLPSC